MKFGSSYYAEYQPYERLETDLDLMVEAGFTTIRVGESTWASYEPADGEISFDDLARVIDAAGARGLEVIIGTPSYAVPPWLARTHPEVMAVVPSGATLPYGARQNVDFTNPTYRRFVERLVTAMGERFGHHDAVVGFQVDNEIGVYELSNPHVIDRFRQWVLGRYGSVEEINKRWGLTYWSHRLTDIEDLWSPAGNTNPAYALEWSRFQAELTVEFLSWQRDLLRPIIAERMFVFHDVVGGDSVTATAIRGVPAAMDRTGVNIYFPMQNALALPDPPRDETLGLAPWWLIDRSASTLLWRSDMAWSLRGLQGESFAVTEAQAGSIGDHVTSVPPYPGQLQLVAHAFLVRGADLLAYWHWHTLHYGAETYWGGVLGHDLEPGRIWREVAAIGAELGEFGTAGNGLVPDADVALLASRDSLKALQFSPPLLVEGTDQADPHSYHRIQMRMYDGALAARAQLRIVHEDSDLRQCRVLLVPALYIASDDLLNELVDVARSGVHVIVTFRTGYADEHAQVRATRAPGPLRDALGVSYQEFTTLLGGRPLAAGADGDLVQPGSRGEAWADLLVTEADNVEVLARYAGDPFLGDHPAIVSRAVGSGRITWIGTLPDSGTMERIVGWALAERGVSPLNALWGEVPPSVRVSSAVLADGRRVWAVANHSWDRVSVTLPDAATLAATGEALGGVLELGAWESKLVTTPAS